MYTEGSRDKFIEVISSDGTEPRLNTIPDLNEYFSTIEAKCAEGSRESHVQYMFVQQLNSRFGLSTWAGDGNPSHRKDESAPIAECRSNVP